MTEAVISLGGSIIFKDYEFNFDFLEKFFEAIKPIERGGIVVGGGNIARVYTKVREKGIMNDNWLDQLGINITRNNALVVKHFFEKKGKGFQFIKHPLEIKEKLVISGGFFPGLTTDACAVLIAEQMGIKKVINISNVDGVYDRNPKERGAKKLKELSLEKLGELALKEENKPGAHFIFDIVAIKLAERGIEEIHFVSNDIEEIKKAIKGEKHNGSVCYNLNLK